MTKNPFLNALGAAAYIGLLVFVLFVVVGEVEHTLPERLTFLMPLTMLSMFVLSAAVMGYIFLYEPVLMILDGKRKEGATLFIQTVAAFAGFALILVAALALLG